MGKMKQILLCNKRRYVKCLLNKNKLMRKERPEYFIAKTIHVKILPVL